MRIKRFVWQYRRDFKAIYECPFCGNAEEGSGYDDEFFHRNVIPKMRCGKCGKTELDEGADYRPLAPRYPEGMQA
jgi:transcription elongation factor Elf1